MFMITSPCESSAILKVIYFILEILKVAFILIPIGLIVMLSVDFAKNVISNEEEMDKNKKLAIRRTILCVAIFMVPFFSKTAFNLLDDSQIISDYTTCIANANLETIADVAEGEEIIKYEKELKEQEEMEKIKAPTDPISGRKIVSKKSKGSNTDDDNDNIKVENANAESFLDTLQRISKVAQEDYKKNKPWRYNGKWGVHSKSFSEAVKSKNRYLTCVRLPAWALIEVGIIDKGAFIQNEIYGAGPRHTSKKRFNKYLEMKKFNNKKLSTLLKEDKLKPGDIVLYHSNHQNVYAGNKKFYDAGRIGKNGCSGNLDSFKTFGPIKYDSNKGVYAVYRFKN